MAHVLVTGGSGFLGSHVARALLAQGHEVHATHGQHAERVPPGAVPVPVDLADESSIEAAFRAAWPDVVVHTAALTEAKPCEVDRDRAHAINVAASARLARLAAAFGARLLHLSTDQVFAGDAGPYAEDAATGPLQTYGITKRDAEDAVRRFHPHATVLRVALAYGASPTGDRSASERLLHDLRAGRRPRLFSDEVRSPILADDVALAVAELIALRDVPLLHLGGPEHMSRHAFGREVALAFGFDAEQLEAVSLDAVDIMPPRPRDVSLDTRRLRALLVNKPRGVREGLGVVAAAWRAGLASQAAEIEP